MESYAAATPNHQQMTMLKFLISLLYTNAQTFALCAVNDQKQNAEECFTILSHLDYLGKISKRLEPKANEAPEFCLTYKGFKLRFRSSAAERTQRAVETERERSHSPITEIAAKQNPVLSQPEFFQSSNGLAESGQVSGSERI